MKAYRPSEVVVNNTLFIDKTENAVGINTMTPKANLDVVGKIQCSDDLIVGGNITATSITATGFNIIPPGCLMMYPSNTPPSGWLLCNGSAVSRLTYSALFAIIGTTYGTGDGSTTFHLPDMRGRTPIGTGTGTGLTARNLGQTGGAETHTLTTSEMPSHTHSATTNGAGSHTHGIYDPGHSHMYQKPQSQNLGFGQQGNVTDGMQTYSTTGAFTGIIINASGDHSHTVTVNSQGSGGSHNNMQPFLVVNYIIKT